MASEFEILILDSFHKFFLLYFAHMNKIYLIHEKISLNY